MPALLLLLSNNMQIYRSKIVRHLNQVKSLYLFMLLEGVKDF